MPQRPPAIMKRSLMRGLRTRCPQCGVFPLFKAYLKPHTRCPGCDQSLNHYAADDAPPYLTLFIVGHVVVGMMLMIDQRWAPPMWVEIVLAVVSATFLTLLLLPRMKGAVIGVLWALEQENQE